MSTAASASWMVFGAFSLIIWSTGFCSWYDSPRSPRTRRPTNLYVLHVDRLVEPSARGSGLDASGVAFLPASCCAGSPGIANMMRNVMTVTPMRTITSWMSRRMTYVSMRVTLPHCLHPWSPGRAAV